MFNGKNILITGGTGSFGKKYAEIILIIKKSTKRIKWFGIIVTKIYYIKKKFNE